MAKEEKNIATENVAENKEEQQLTTPGGVPVEVVTKKHPVKDFFAKNKKKIGVGLGIAGAFAAGVVCDKIGIKLPGKKDPEEEAAE